MSGCQLQELPAWAAPLHTGEVAWQWRNRLRRIAKRRWRYLMHFARRLRPAASLEGGAAPVRAVRWQPGDWVRVRSREEIQRTLDPWNQLHHCSFMEEMWPYCGTRQQVHKRVERFLDERDYRIKSCKGLVSLKEVMCQGTRDFGACDRSCFFFWRDEWLEPAAID